MGDVMVARLKSFQGPITRFYSTAMQPSSLGFPGQEVNTGRRPLTKLAWPVNCALFLCKTTSQENVMEVQLGRFYNAMKFFQTLEANNKTEIFPQILNNLPRPFRDTTS